jgi:HAD superfamily hydrolase (TIGR01490 family)
MLGPMEAAFFDLDKTVIAKASMVAFGRPLYDAGMVSRWLVARALWSQLVFQHRGADEERMRKFRESALRVTRGWDQARVSTIVRETLTEVIDPIVYDEALDLIRQHQAAGRRVYLISASPEEIVAPLARYLGVDEAIASRASLDEAGRYTGEVEFYSYGPFKAEAIRLAAAERGIDLAASYAYSDSATDLPMLEVVGHPVAVNPDRDLAKVARDREWDVLWFDHGVALRDRVSMPARRQTAVGAILVIAVVTATTTWWLWRRRGPAGPTIGGPAWTGPASLARARRVAGRSAAGARSVGSGLRRPGASSPQRRPARRRRGERGASS